MQDTSETIRIQWLELENAMRTRLSEPGVVPPAGLAQRSGLEFLQGICRGELPLPPISKALEFFPVEVESGRVVFHGTPKLAYYNPIGSVHGGWAATLLDSCAGCAIHSMLSAGKGYTTLELKVNFVRAITSDTGPVRAEGKVIHVGNRVGTAEGRLVDSAGRLHAHATTTCLIFDLPK